MLLSPIASASANEVSVLVLPPKPIKRTDGPPAAAVVVETGETLVADAGDAVIMAQRVVGSRPRHRVIVVLREVW